MGLGNFQDDARLLTEAAKYLSYYKDEPKQVLPFVYSSRSKCGYRGVNQSGSHWRARIKVQGSMVDLGRFDTAVDAAQAYSKAARGQGGILPDVSTTSQSSEPAPGSVSDCVL